MYYHHHHYFYFFSWSLQNVLIIYFYDSCIAALYRCTKTGTVSCTRTRTQKNFISQDKSAMYFEHIEHNTHIFSSYVKACIYVHVAADNFYSTFDSTESLKVHQSDVIMSEMVSQISSVAIVYLTVCSGTDQRKHKAPRHWPLWGEFTG